MGVPQALNDVRRWGLVPHWAEEPKTPYSTFNVRAETVAEKAAFPEPLYERFTVTYPASGTVIPSFYCGGATLREVQVSHSLAQVKVDEDSRVELPRDISSA